MNCVAGNSFASSRLRLRGGTSDQDEGTGHILGSKVPRKEIRTLPQVIPPPEFGEFGQFVTRSNSYSALDEATVTENLSGYAPTDEEQLINIGKTGQTEAQPKPEAINVEDIEGQLDELSKAEDQVLRVVIISSEVGADYVKVVPHEIYPPDVSARPRRLPLSLSPAALLMWHQSSPSRSARRAIES